MFSGSAPQVPVILKNGVKAYGLTQSIINISWGAVTGATQYRLFRNGSLLTTRSGAGALNYSNTSGLSANTDYTYMVIADLADGSSRHVGTDTARLQNAPLKVVDSFEDVMLDNSAYIQGWYVQNPTITVTDRIKPRKGTRCCKLYYPYTDVLLYDPRHSEIQTNSIYVAPVSTGLWWGLSSYLDSSYLVIDHVDNPELIWQWHGTLDGPSSFDPALYIGIFGNQAGIYVNVGDYPASTTLTLISSQWDITQDCNKWVDWVGYTVFDYVNGVVKIWKDGVQIVNYNGPTLYHLTSGQTNELGPYLNLGQYKWRWNLSATNVAQRTMYLDEIRIADSTANYATVAPAQYTSITVQYPEVGTVAPKWYANFKDNYYLYNGGDFTFAAWKTAITAAHTRASSAYRTNESGLLESVGNNVSRFEYNRLTQTCKGFLLEGASTNLALQSQTLTVSWAGSGTVAATCLADKANGPEGFGGTADIVQFGANADSYWSQSFTFGATTSYTLSVYARAAHTAATKTFRLRWNDGSSSANSADLTATVDWQRFSLTFTTSGGAGAGNFGFINGSSGAAGGVALWGAQLEAKSFATSYIPTTTGSATRAADVFQITASPWYSTTAGSFYAGIGTFSHVNGVMGRIIGNSATSRGPLMENLTDVGSYNGTTVLTKAAVIDGTTRSKLMSTYDATGRAITAQGAAPASDANAFGDLTNVRLGCDSVPNSFFGIMRDAAYWDIRASDAELQRLTTVTGSDPSDDTKWVTWYSFQFYKPASNLWCAYNSTWNQGSNVNNVDFTQTISGLVGNFPQKTLIEWVWPGTDPPSGPPYAYPCLIYGDYGFNVKSSTLPVPAQLKRCPRMVFNFDVTNLGDSSNYDIIFDTLVLSSYPSTAGGAETMAEPIFALHTPEYAQTYLSSLPANQKSSLTSQGRTWNLFWIVRPPAYPYLWIADSAWADILSGSFDQMPFINKAIQLGWLTGDEYFCGTSLGCEPRHGSGAIIINSVSVDVT